MSTNSICSMKLGSCSRLPIGRTIHWKVWWLVAAQKARRSAHISTRDTALQNRRGAEPLEGLVAGGRPESQHSREYLDKIAGHSKLKGIRRVLHTQPDDVGKGSNFIKHVAALPEYDLSFDICVLGRPLPIAIEMVSKCPNTAFLLDHCGAPRVKEKDLDPWRARISEIAKATNVVCKVSGVVAYADPKN